MYLGSILELLLPQTFQIPTYVLQQQIDLV